MKTDSLGYIIQEPSLRPSEDQRAQIQRKYGMFIHLKLE